MLALDTVDVKVYSKGISIDDIKTIKEIYIERKDNHEYDVPLKRLGGGVTGTVYQYKNFAIKMGGVSNDIKILNKLSHLPFIPKIYASINNGCVIMELIEGETVFDYIECNKKHVEIEESILTDLENCIKNIISAGYYPDDCHSKNVMIDNNGKIRIVDVGYYTEIHPIDDNEEIKRMINLSTGMRWSGDLFKKHFNLPR